MEQNDQAQLAVARLLYDNFWLLQAERTCQAILVGGANDEALAMLADS